MLYDHFTVKELLFDLHIETQRLSEYASQAEKICRLGLEGKVNPLICDDLLTTISKIARDARVDAKVLMLTALRKMESVMDPRSRKKAAKRPKGARTQAKASGRLLISHRIVTEKLHKPSSRKGADVSTYAR